MMCAKQQGVNGEAFTLSVKAKVALWLILAFSTLFLLLIVELAARAYLRANDLPSYSLLLHKADKTQNRETVFERRLSQGLTLLDPLLGYARPPGGDPGDPAWRWPGFKTLGDEDEAALRIIVLGGSTSDPFYEDEWGSWSAVLYDRLRASGVQAVVYNGAVSGYSTNQELLKLLRDAGALSPDIVISLSGVNDLGFAHSLSDHPMVSPYQATMMEALTGRAARTAPLMPNFIAAVSSRRNGASELSVTKGVAAEITDAEMWRRNVAMMHAVSAQLGAAFYVFLQPAMGTDAAYSASAEEAVLYRKMLEMRPGYKDEARRFYASARQSCAALDYCADFSEIFSGKSGMYHDPRHPNAEGNKLIGEKIFETLRAAEKI